MTDIQVIHAARAPDEVIELRRQIFNLNEKLKNAENAVEIYRNDWSKEYHRARILTSAIRSVKRMRNKDRIKALIEKALERAS